MPKWKRPISWSALIICAWIFCHAASPEIIRKSLLQKQAIPVYPHGLTCASREFNLDNPIKGIPGPRLTADRPVMPFKKEEIELLIKTGDFCEETVADRRREFIL